MHSCGPAGYFESIKGGNWASPVALNRRIKNLVGVNHVKRRQDSFWEEKLFLEEYVEALN